MPVTVTWDEVTAFRLSRHHLLDRIPTDELASVVGDMGGAQAQLLSAAKASLWPRIRDLQIAQVDEALNDRTLVRAACMRQTLFLVPSSQLAVFVRGSARRAEKEIRWARGKGVPERVIEAAINATLDVLDQPLTRTEIAERVGRALGVGTQAFQGGGWGNQRQIAAVPVGDLAYPVVDLLHLVAARGVVCYGPSQGNELTFVRADAWIPQWQDMPREEAETNLLRIYLRAYAPATATDFAWWTGMILRDAREIWAREQANIAQVDVEGWVAEILREDLEALSQARIESPLIRLLPHFDSFLLGHKDREHLLATKHQPKIYRPQGWIVPVVLLNGRVIAVWENSQKKERLLVKVERLEPISRNTVGSIYEEAQDLGRFLGIPNVDVKFG